MKLHLQVLMAAVLGFCMGVIATGIYSDLRRPKAEVLPAQIELVCEHLRMRGHGCGRGTI